MKDWDSTSRTGALIVSGVVLIIFVFLSACNVNYE